MRPGLAVPLPGHGGLRRAATETGRYLFRPLGAGEAGVSGGGRSERELRARRGSAACAAPLSRGAGAARACGAATGAFPGFAGPGSGRGGPAQGAGWRGRGARLLRPQRLPEVPAAAFSGALPAPRGGQGSVWQRHGRRTKTAPSRGAASGPVRLPPGAVPGAPVFLPVLTLCS